MSSAPKLTPDGYTDEEEAYALRLYDTELVGRGPTAAVSGAAKLNSQSTFLVHALASVPAPGNLPQRIWNLYIDEGGYRRSSGDVVVAANDPGNPFGQFNDNLKYWLLHSRHYGRSLAPRKLSTGAFADTGTSTLLVTMDWLEAALDVGFRPRTDTRVTYKRRGGGASGDEVSNIIDLEFESALTGLLADAASGVLQLREIVPTDLFNVRVADPQSKLIRPVPTRVQVHTAPAFGAALLFELNFAVSAGIEALFPTTEKRLEWATLYATRVLGYLTIVRVLNAGALSCAASARAFTTGGIKDAIVFEAGWALFKNLAARLHDTIKGAKFFLSDQLLADIAAKTRFTAQSEVLLETQLGRSLLRDVTTTRDLGTNALDPLRRLVEGRIVLRRVDELQDEWLRGWRGQIAINIGKVAANNDAAERLETPSTIIAFAQQDRSAKAIYEDTYKYPRGKMANEIWAAEETASKYPATLTAPASPDDERMFRVLQEQSEVALRVVYRYLGESLAIVFANCIQDVPTGAPLVDLLENYAVGDDDLGRASLLYVIGVSETSRIAKLPLVGLPGGATLAESVAQLSKCVGEAAGLSSAVLTLAGQQLPGTQKKPEKFEPVIARLRKLVADNNAAAVTADDIALANNFLNNQAFYVSALESLRELSAIVDSKTRWRAGLQKLAPLPTSLAQKIIDNVPATLAALQAATLAQAGVARELSNRLRLYVEDAARLAAALKVKTTKEIERLVFELELLVPLAGRDVAQEDLDAVDDEIARARASSGIDAERAKKLRADAMKARVAARKAKIARAPLEVQKEVVDEQQEEAKYAELVQQLVLRGEFIGKTKFQIEGEAQSAADAASKERRAYKRTQLSAELDVWQRRQEPNDVVIESISQVAKLASVAEKRRAISRENNTLVMLHLDNAVQVVRGGRLTVPGAAGAGATTPSAVIGGDEARRYFASVFAALQNAHTLSESLELFYEKGRDALDKIREKNAQLRPDEEAQLIEQTELNRQLENNVIAGHIDTALRLALFAARLPWASQPELVNRIGETQDVLAKQKASLDSTTFVGYARRLLASLRDTAKSLALADSRMEQLLAGQVSAITHLGVAGYIMEAELALARWQQRSDADLAALEAPLRAAEELVARRTLASLVAAIRSGALAPGTAQQLFDEYRALLETLSGTTRIDYVPIPSQEILDQFEQGGVSAQSTKIIANLKRYDVLQREYYGEVVVREPVSKTYEDVLFIGKRQLSVDAQRDVQVRMKTYADMLRLADAALLEFLPAGPAAFLHGAQKTWYSEDTFGQLLQQSHAALLRNLADIDQKVDNSMDVDNPRESLVDILQRNSAAIYADLRLVVVNVNAMFITAVAYLSSAPAKERIAEVDVLFGTLRMLQETAAALLKQYFATDIRLPSAAERELPWKVVDLAVLNQSFQDALASLGLS
jgi:hypothetical protein